MNRREFGRLAGASAVLAIVGGRALAADWQATLAAAKNQTVYFHAWGGDAKINDFIAWIGDLALTRHGVTLTTSSWPPPRMPWRACRPNRPPVRQQAGRLTSSGSTARTLPR